MYLSLLQDSRLYPLLFKIDEDLASEARRSRCRFCGAALHSACYLRKPRGLPAGVHAGPAYRIRFSFCCSAEGCRKRHTPPSVRFLGPKVYLGVMVVLLAAMRQGTTPRSAKTLRRTFGVDRRTLARWRVWWQTVFPETRFWQRLKARFMPPVDQDGLPATLVDRFGADAGAGLFDRVVRLLRFLSRLTTAF